jgi:hypothetical protein
MQSVFRRSRHVCWDTHHSGRSSKSQNLVGKMTRPAGLYQGKLRVLLAATDLDWSHGECRCCTAMPCHTLLAPQWTSWTLGTGRFLPTLPAVLIWHHRTATCSPNRRNTFEVYASKLMKTSKRRSSDSYVCRTHYFTTKALTLWWSAAVKCLNRYGDCVEKTDCIWACK